MDDSVTLIDLLDRVAAVPDHGLRFIDRHERASFFPWSEIRDRALRCAGGLAALGIERGDRVALVYPTSPEFFDAFFAVLMAGGIPVPLYPPVRLGRLDEYTARTAAMLGAVDARLVLADTRVRRILGTVIELAKPWLGCRTVASLDDDGLETDAPQSTDLAMIQFSSGTTSVPRPVALSHRAVVAQTIRLNRFWPDGNGITHSGVSWLPLYHDMGLIGCVFPALERGADLTLLPPELFVARPAVWLRCISKYRATVSPAPNFAYGLCVEKIRDEDLEGVDLSQWGVALCGAEPVAARVLRAFQDRFARWGFRAEALTPVYGLSEASLAVTFSEVSRPFTSRFYDRDLLADERVASEDPAGVEIVSVGRPLPDFEIRIVDANGEQKPEGEIGRLEVSGPSLMDGYFGQPRETARAIRDGWLDTGDLGFLASGELFLTGRSKDLIILRGRNHSPIEVEHALDDVEGVRTGCTLAASFVPDGGAGEELVVLAEAMGNQPAGRYPVIAGEMARAVRAATGLDPQHVEVLPPGTLPRTSSGKIRRRQGILLWQAGELAPPVCVTPFKIASSILRSTLAMARSRRSRGRS